MFLLNLLADEGGKKSGAQSYILIGVMVLLLIAFFVWSTISNKKKQKQFNDTVNAIKPGSKVKTIGGICGIVVSVNNEENTFVLRTGEDGNEANYIKFDKQAIYQTDAKAEPAVKEPVKEEKVEEKPAEEVQEVEAVDETKEEK